MFKLMIGLFEERSDQVEEKVDEVTHEASLVGTRWHSPAKSHSIFSSPLLISYSLFLSESISDHSHSSFLHDFLNSLIYFSFFSF